MKKQIVKEFITVKRVRRLPRPPAPPAPPPPLKVLVVGRCTLDIITICNEHPTPGQVQRTTEGTWRLGGSASNVCIVLRRLGMECSFLGQLTSALTFESLESSFQAMGVDISTCPRTPKSPAHRNIVGVRGDDTHTIVEYSSPEHELTYQQFVGAVDYRKYAWIHFESRRPKETLRMLKAVQDFNALNPETRIVVSVDLNDMRPINLLMGEFADYVLVRSRLQTQYAYMNGRETVWAVREQMAVARKRWMASRAKKRPCVIKRELVEPAHEQSCALTTERQPIIIVENYSEGASCLMTDGVYFKVGAHTPQKVVDSIGEHDAFVGAFIYALLEPKLTLRDAMEYGTRATVLKIGDNGFDCLRRMPKDLISCYYTQQQC